jgi:hypothetical protein
VIRRHFFTGCLLTLWLLPMLARAGGVQASLDRHQVELGETVTLNLRVADPGSQMAMPDLSPLSTDFDILGTSQNNSLSVINGTSTSTLTFGVALRPKHAGTLQIPALDVAGGHTAPLTLQVTPPDPSATAANKDVFVEAQVAPAHGYVGQQLSYVVRLFYAVNLSRGSIDQPQVNGVEINQIGDDISYRTERGGRAYEVRERHFALTPQHAGHIEITPANFQGDAVDPNDPNSFFGASNPVSASAPAVAIDVQAPPADWGASAWLPARQLTLSLDGLPGAGKQVRVGQPLNLTMNLQATGLAYDALPALSLPALDGATVYPDKPVTGNRINDRWMVGRRQQEFAVVPERAGTLTIPATTLKWWNVQTNRMEVATIPEHSLTILPAAGGASQSASTSTASPSTAATPAPGTGTVSTAIKAGGTPWRWIAIGSAVLWLLSVLAWLLWRRRLTAPAPKPQMSPRPTARQEQQAFLAAARTDDTLAQSRTLLAWARTERPAIQHLGQLAAALGDAAQQAAVEDLQQRRYAGAPRPGDRVSLGEVFKRGLVWRKTDTGEQEPELPPLYPFKLH